jgi:hypothetical protein
MAANEREEILRPNCYLPVASGVDSHPDDEDRTVHEACAIKKSAAPVRRAVPRYYGESKFDCFA